MAGGALRRAVYVDTSGWYALLVERDQNHRAAARQFQALGAERRPLVVTNYVAAETYTLLRVRRGAEAALGFLRRLRATQTVHKVRVEEEWERAAEELLEKYRDHELSYVDATSFVAMRKLALSEVMSFDGDFATAGFRILP
ncbi:MAG: type II toxin-antitoxin system VapC family toxin [Chloroflexota bacterium]|nr:type II toxin-antitoxin system VapC family toxin [Chloroflexota bacterium]